MMQDLLIKGLRRQAFLADVAHVLPPLPFAQPAVLAIGRKLVTIDDDLLASGAAITTCEAPPNSETGSPKVGLESQRILVFLADRACKYHRWRRAGETLSMTSFPYLASAH